MTETIYALNVLNLKCSILQVKDGLLSIHELHISLSCKADLIAMGVVTLLSGQPKEGVSLEARSDLKGSYEETVTDSSGSYHLRGLHPDTSYTIRVVAFSNASDLISRTLFCAYDYP
ncbi:nodal modulator 1 [Tanacetum coccineum]